MASTICFLMILLLSYFYIIRRILDYSLFSPFRTEQQVVKRAARNRNYLPCDKNRQYFHFEESLDERLWTNLLLVSVSSDWFGCVLLISSEKKHSFVLAEELESNWVVGSAYHNRNSWHCFTCLLGNELASSVSLINTHTHTHAHRWKETPQLLTVFMSWRSLRSSLNFFEIRNIFIILNWVKTKYLCKRSHNQVYPLWPFSSGVQVSGGNVTWLQQINHHSFMHSSHHSLCPRL